MFTKVFIAAPCGYGVHLNTQTTVSHPLRPTSADNI